jgi:hypothetical protein
LGGPLVRPVLWHDPEHHLYRRLAVVTQTNASGAGD